MFGVKKKFHLMTDEISIKNHFFTLLYFFLFRGLGFADFYFGSSNRLFYNRNSPLFNLSNKTI